MPFAILVLAGVVSLGGLSRSGDRDEDEAERGRAEEEAEEQPGLYRQLRRYERDHDQEAEGPAGEDRPLVAGPRPRAAAPAPERASRSTPSITIRGRRGAPGGGGPPPEAPSGGGDAG